MMVTTTLDEIRDLMIEQNGLLREIVKRHDSPAPTISMNDKVMMAILLLPEVGPNMLEISRRVDANRTTMIRSAKWAKFRTFFEEFKNKGPSSSNEPSVEEIDE